MSFSINFDSGYSNYCVVPQTAFGTKNNGLNFGVAITSSTNTTETRRCSLLGDTGGQDLEEKVIIQGSGIALHG